MLNWSILFRSVLPAVLAIAFAARPAPAQTGQLDASPTLFTVLAAINSAGYDADLDSPSNHPLRKEIREEIAKRHVPSLTAIRDFYASHHLSNPAADLSQYISFALSVGPPPNFNFNAKDVDLPPDVAGMKALQPLLVAFYKEAGIADLWKRSQPAIDQVIARYHQPVSDAVLQVNLYLRWQTSGVRGRRFQIFVAPQASPNQIQTRSYGDEYTIVVTPSSDLRSSDIRHGYLHYLLDPLASRASEILARKEILAKNLDRAPAIDGVYKEDFQRLTTECLIKAVESRLDRRPDIVVQSLHQGFILTPYFAEQLAVYEKQPAAMVLYYQQMVQAIDLVKEEKRLASVVFDREPLPAHTIPVLRALPPEPVLTPAAKTLNAAEELYLKRDLDPAQKLYLEVLSQTDQKSIQAGAYYGLARIAVLRKDPETAERMFHKTLDLDPEPQVKAWALVYLGRLSLAANEKGDAAKFFGDALQVSGATDAARKAAQEGIRQSSNQQ